MSLYALSVSAFRRSAPRVGLVEADVEAGWDLELFVRLLAAERGSPHSVARREVAPTLRERASFASWTRGSTYTCGYDCQIMTRVEGGVHSQHTSFAVLDDTFFSKNALAFSILSSSESESNSSSSSSCRAIRRVSSDIVNFNSEMYNSFITPSLEADVVGPENVTVELSRVITLVAGGLPRLGRALGPTRS